MLPWAGLSLLCLALALAHGTRGHRISIELHTDGERREAAAPGRGLTQRILTKYAVFHKIYLEESVPSAYDTFCWACQVAGCTVFSVI